MFSSRHRMARHGVALAADRRYNRYSFTNQLRLNFEHDQNEFMFRIQKLMRLRRKCRSDRERERGVSISQLWKTTQRKASPRDPSLNGRKIDCRYLWLFVFGNSKTTFSNQKQTKQNMWKCMKQTAIWLRPRIWELYAEYNWIGIHAVVTAAEAFTRYFMEIIK